MSKTIGNAPDKLYIIIPAIINMVLNLIYVIIDIIKIIKKKDKKSKIASLEKFVHALSISEIMISLFWVVSGFLPSDLVEADTPECKSIGCFQTFFYLYELLLLQGIISHLKYLILNPLNHILKSKKILLNSILINFSISLGITLIYFFLEIIGISPMHSCFLKFKIFYEDNVYRKILLIIILLVPLFVIAYIAYQIFVIIKNDSYKNDSLNKQLFKMHIYYLLAYLLIFFLFPILYFIVAIKGENIEIFSFIISLFLVIFPIIIGIFRLYKNRLNFSISNNQIEKNSTERTTPLLDVFNLTKTYTFQEQAERFEMSAIKKFVMNFYICVCFCLEKNLSAPDLKYQDFIDDNIDKKNNYTITQEIIADQLTDGQLIGDSIVRSRENISISCVEYSPSIFRYLRQLDKVSDEMIVTSMLPMNNKIGIKETEGRGGSFFINSDDHEFIIKTITEQEFKILMRLLHNKMVEYFQQNNDSLICRIYGAYKLSISTGFLKKDDIYFILMKNVIGSFFDNLLCKYDLKGSSLNRKVEYENMDKKVMKDVNFNEVEEIFFLNKQDSKKLLKLVEKDAKFLCESEVMDYSLLVAKITLNNAEMNYLFGKNHRKNAEIQYMQMIGQETQNTNISIDSIDDKETQKDIDKINLIETKEKDIRFKKDNIECLKKYIFPSLKPDIIYIMSIIDFFQIYNLQKNLEQKYKKLKTGVKKEDISSIPPDDYKERFIEFVKGKTDSENYLKQLYNPENQNDF